MLGQRLRRWLNIKPTRSLKASHWTSIIATLLQRLHFQTGKQLSINAVCVSCDVSPSISHQTQGLTTPKCQSYWNTCKMPQFHGPILLLFVAPSPLSRAAYHNKAWTVHYKKTAPIKGCYPDRFCARTPSVQKGHLSSN